MTKYSPTEPASSRSRPDWDPERYRRWFETPLGRMVDADEKDVLFELADLQSGERVLDVGCGEGNFTRAAAEGTGWAVGIDPSEPMLRAAASQGRQTVTTVYIRGTGEGLPFADASFEAALMVTVLCFAGNPGALVDEIHRVLRPGGRLIVGELNRYSVWAAVRAIRGRFGDPIWSRARFHSTKELRALLESRGFTGIVTGGAVLYPPWTRAALLRMCRPVETLGRSLCARAGAFIVVRGTK